MNPVARRDGLLTRELPGELLVYELGEHRAHCLNRTAATVFKNADGTRTVAELARYLAPEGDRAAVEAVVEETLARLSEVGLLESGPSVAGWSRREMVRRVGIGAAVLLPAVASIVVPSPAEAAATCVESCAGRQDGTPCDTFGACANPTATCVSECCSDTAC
jgi:Coenzyme PQQ synthesis protein D (PqqD)